jgi:CHAD domain-containing protein
MLRSFVAARPFYVYLSRREARLLKGTRKEIKRLRTGGLGKLLDRCRVEAEANRDEGTPKQAAARLLRSVDGAFARTARLRARVDPKRTKTIHRTRIAFKKFRYMAEALAAHLPGANEKTLAAMHHYQTMMGDIQDIEVLLGTLDKFLGKEHVPPGPARYLREELLRRRNWLVRVFMDHAYQLDGFWPAAMARSGGKAQPGFVAAPQSTAAGRWAKPPVGAAVPGPGESPSHSSNPN